MSNYNYCYPFAAVVGQEQAKRALKIALVNPKAGGLLISGVTGTAKSVVVRSAAMLAGNRKIINLPLNVTEDMLFGSINLEYAVSQGERRFEPGLLGRADGNILYIDEVNLLRPELLTAVLDINIAGENRVERDGISFAHKTEYTVIGTMDPHEGLLPNHLLDRFGLFVETENLEDKEQRKMIMQRLLDFSRDRNAFIQSYRKETEQLKVQIAKARELLPEVEISEAMMELAVQYCTQAFVQGTGQIFICWKRQGQLPRWQKEHIFCPRTWKKLRCMCCHIACGSRRNQSRRKKNRLRKNLKSRKKNPIRLMMLMKQRAIGKILFTFRRHRKRLITKTIQMKITIRMKMTKKLPTQIRK